METAVQFSRQPVEPQEVNIESGKIAVEDSSKLSIASLNKNLSTLSSFVQNLVLLFNSLQIEKDQN